MVRIDSVYTKTGDGGQTRLSDGTAVPKTHPRMMACGEIDEASSMLGLIACESGDADLRATVARIQNDLFDLGADVASPIGCVNEARIPRITHVQVDWLEEHIEAINKDLEPLRSFILPGGSRLSSLLHLVRTVVRRAERTLVRLMQEDFDGVNPVTLVYINRLSDWCFVAARQFNDGGRGDILWQPGAHR